MSQVCSIRIVCRSMLERGVGGVGVGVVKTGLVFVGG
jgi:hypothetical protein